jgi:TonB family protein
VTSDVPIVLPPDLSASCAGRTVGLHLVIAEDGSLRSAKVISTSTVPGCDEATLDAVKRYRFKPALDTEEKPIEGRLLISVHF